MSGFFLPSHNGGFPGPGGGADQSPPGLDHDTSDWKLDVGGDKEDFDISCTSLAAHYCVHENCWQDKGLHYASDESGNVIGGTYYTAAQELQARLNAGETSFSVSWNNLIADQENGSYYKLPSAWKKICYGMCLNALMLNGTAFTYNSASVILAVSFDKENAKLNAYISEWNSGEQEILVLPSELTEIGANAFAGVKATRIELPAGLKTIGSMAFAGSKVKTVLIPDSLESIAADAFNDCGNIIFVVHSNSVATAFAAERNNITVVTVP